MKQTQDEVIVNAEQVRLDAKRAEIALLNRNEMIKLMGQYGILIPARRLAWWRPTERTTGDIDGLHESLTIIATDGLLGWYLTSDGEAWCGHTQCFSQRENIKPLFKFNSGSKPRVKSRRQQIIDNM